MDRNFEFKYMADFAYESYLIEELARDQFRALWMAYCLHHNLDADTSEYDDDLAQLWNVVSENGDGTTMIASTISCPAIWCEVTMEKRVIFWPARRSDCRRMTFPLRI